MATPHMIPCTLCCFTHMASLGGISACSMHNRETNQGAEAGVEAEEGVAPGGGCQWLMTVLQSVLVSRATRSKVVGHMHDGEEGRRGGDNALTAKV